MTPSASQNRIDRLIEPVRRVYAGLHSFLNMSLMEARRRKASALLLRFSQSFASLRHRPSQAKVRSTTHRLGRTPALGPDKLDMARRLIAENKGRGVVARMLGVDPSTLRRALNGKS
jgi:hypothetical protein